MKTPKAKATPHEAHHCRIAQKWRRAAPSTLREVTGVHRFLLSANMSKMADIINVTIAKETLSPPPNMAKFGDKYCSCTCDCSSSSELCGLKIFPPAALAHLFYSSVRCGQGKTNNRDKEQERRRQEKRRDSVLKSIIHFFKPQRRDEQSISRAYESRPKTEK